MKLSLVVPVLNQEKYVEDCILSVLRQEFQAVELIIKDGGSTDQTLEIAKRYPIRIISQADNGQSEAINHGFLASSGDFVGWLNADDYLLPGSLQAIKGFVETHDSVDVIYGDSIFVDADGRYSRLRSGHDFDASILHYYGTYLPSSGGVFLKSEVIKEGLLLDPKFRVTMDFEYYVRLAESGKRFRYLARPLAAFRWHGTNVSLDAVERRKERLRVQRIRHPEANDLFLNAMAKLFGFKRVALKVANGSYRREFCSRHLIGADTKWFSGDDQAVSNVDRILKCMNY